MALPKITAPNPTAFASDPVEQIFQRGVLDRDMSGLAFMLANAAQDRGAANQQTYMRGLEASNALARQLAQQEAQAEMQKEMLKGMITLSQHGYLPKDMPISAALFSDPNAATVSEPSTLANALTQAKINQANAAATASRSGGGDQYTTEYIMDPNGVPQIKMVQKGRQPPDPSNPVVLEMMRKRGIQFDPNKPYAYMSRAEAEAAAKAVADGKFRNIRD